MTKSAEDWLKEAEQHVTVSDHDKAILCYDEALKIKRDYSDALLGKSLALVSLGKPLEALRWYDRIIELDPENAIAHSRKAIALNNLRRSSEALEFANKALKLSPQSDLAHSTKAIVLRDMGNPEEAIESYRQAIKLNEKRVNALWGLGSLLYQQGKLAEALECYKAAAHYQPCAVFYLLIGQCLQNLDMTNEAVEAFVACIDYFEKGEPGIGLSAGNLRYIKEKIQDIQELHITAVKAEEKIKELEAKTLESNISDHFIEDLVAKNAALQADKDRLIHFVISKIDHGGVSQYDKDEVAFLIEEFTKEIQNIEALLSSKVPTDLKHTEGAI